MNNTKQWVKFSKTLLTFGVITLSAPSIAAESVLNAEVYCTSEGQLCDQPFTFDVTTNDTLKIKYIVAEGHCSSIRLHLSVDGTETMVTDFLGWNGDEAAKPLDTGLIDLSPVSVGAHTVSLQAEGIEGGCNAGNLASWGGTVTVIADVTPVIPEAGVGGTLTKMSATNGKVTCQNMKTKKKVVFPFTAGDRTWDCEVNGLVVAPGETVKQTISVSGRKATP